MHIERLEFAKAYIGERGGTRSSHPPSGPPGGRSEISSLDRKVVGQRRAAFYTTSSERHSAALPRKFLVAIRRSSTIHHGVSQDLALTTRRSGADQFVGCMSSFQRSPRAVRQRSPSLAKGGVPLHPLRGDRELRSVQAAQRGMLFARVSPRSASGASIAKRRTQPDRSVASLYAWSLGSIAVAPNTCSSRSARHSLGAPHPRVEPSSIQRQGAIRLGAALNHQVVSSPKHRLASDSLHAQREAAERCSRPRGSRGLSEIHQVFWSPTCRLGPDRGLSAMTMVSKDIGHHAFDFVNLGWCTAHLGHGRRPFCMCWPVGLHRPVPYLASVVIAGDLCCVCADVEFSQLPKDTHACFALLAISLRWLPIRKLHFSKGNFPALVSMASCSSSAQTPRGFQGVAQLAFRDDG